MDELTYSAIVIDGKFTDYFDDPAIPAVCFEGMTWDQLGVICRVSFRQGFQVVVMPETVKEGAADG